MKKILFILFVLILSYSTYGQLLAGVVASSSQSVYDDGKRPVLSNFRVENDYPGRLYFDSSEDIQGGTWTGMTISGFKGVSSLFINTGNTTGHYLVLNSPTFADDFTFWDNNTIRYEGGANIRDVSDNYLHPFTLQYITNNIVEPDATDHTFYVDGSVVSSGDGLTEVNAFKTIAEGLTAINNEASSEGSTLWIKAYNYGAAVVTLGSSGTATKPIKILGYKTTPGDAPELTRSAGMAFSSAELPLIDGDNFDMNQNDYIIVKNIQVDPNSSSVNGFDLDYADYIHLENIYVEEAKNGIWSLKTHLVTNVRVKRVYLGNCSDTGYTLPVDLGLIEDVFASSSYAKDMDYYINIWGTTNGSHTIIRNCYVERFPSDTHPGHGIAIKADESTTLGDNGYKIEYALVENNIIKNVSDAALELRHSEVQYCVLRGNETIWDGQAGNNYQGIRITSAQNNTIENNIIGAKYNVTFAGSVEDQEATDAGNNNLFRNNIFKGGSDGTPPYIHIYGWDDSDNTTPNDRVFNDNDFLNNTFYDGTNFLWNAYASLSGTGNTITNGIISEVANKSGSGQVIAFTYTYSDFYSTNSGDWSYTAESGTGNVSTNPYLDYGDYMLTSQTTSAVYEGGTDVSVYYDINGVERQTTFSQGAYQIYGTDVFPDYFVNATNGSDTNDGSTEFLAWQTLSKVSSSANTFVPGDIIAFKAGDIFEDNIEFYDDHGTNGNPITYTSYGSGERPIITNVITRPLTWIQDSATAGEPTRNTLWYANTTLTIGRLYKDEVEILRANSDAISSTPTEDETVYELLHYGSYTPSPPVDDFEYVYSGTYNKVWTNVDPTGYDYQFGDDTSRTVYFIGCSYINISNIEIQGGISASLGFHSSTDCLATNLKLGDKGGKGFYATVSSRIEFNSCDVNSEWTFDITGPEDMYKGYSSRGPGDGGHFWGGNTGHKIINCLFTNWLHQSIAIYSYQSPWDLSSGHEIANNTITAPDITYGSGLGFIGNHDGITVHHNYFYKVANSNQFASNGVHVYSNIFDTYPNTLIKGDDEVANIAVVGYLGSGSTSQTGIDGGIFEYNTIMNGDTYGMGLFSDGVSTGLPTNNLIMRNNIIYNTGLNSAASNSYGVAGWINKNNDSAWETYDIIDNVFWNDAGTLLIQHGSATKINVATFVSQSTVDKTTTGNVSLDPEINPDYSLPVGSNVEGYGAMPSPSINYTIGSTLHLAR